MKIFFHFSVEGFSNTYVLGPDDGGDAIIVDPGAMSVALLELIESNEYYLRGALLTHPHDSHSRGLKTLCKIYDIEVFAAADYVLDIRSINISQMDSFEVCGFQVGVIPIRGHSADSVVFTIDDYLFSGDSFSAGTLGSAPNEYASVLLGAEIQRKILSMDKNYLLFPGHGSPSTLDVEKATNPAFKAR